ncbi:pyridoxamine 5'-phosphate oxidase family protein [Blastococcus sp. TF02A-26]|uniref:pyridoxamine 5'-phosphate oxidase family protein n=1 Tax=Blastococcus sp. TF02A-26 TaxID=2250577 RepID=UPI000DEAD57F|nr:pyridoxamine 5'-phosphate oxidase family protein [Blastococcus sp. TF02A-26]RBY79674.1 pyridoxamine 5'-phosphate oxidase family protein [Blastococcus sp. TF02A-26]
MDDHNSVPAVVELSGSACWALLRTTSIGRLAIWLGDHPDIFPLNYAVDHGTIVFRTGIGTKFSASLSDWPVAFEADGYDADEAEAWSVVVKGNAEEVLKRQDMMDTLDLPLHPWQAGIKDRFIRIIPTALSGRRFAVASPDVWQTPLSGGRRSSID